MYTWESHVHERVKDPAYMRGSETERKDEVYVTFQAKDDAPPGFREEEGHSLQADKKHTCSVIKIFSAL